MCIYFNIVCQSKLHSAKTISWLSYSDSKKFGQDTGKTALWLAGLDGWELESCGGIFSLYLAFGSLHRLKPWLGQPARTSFSTQPGRLPSMATSGCEMSYDSLGLQNESLNTQEGSGLPFMGWSWKSHTSLLLCCISEPLLSWSSFRQVHRKHRPHLSVEEVSERKRKKKRSKGEREAGDRDRTGNPYDCKYPVLVSLPVAIIK